VTKREAKKLRAAHDPLGACSGPAWVRGPQVENSCAK